VRRALALLVAAIVTNVVVNTRFNEIADRFPFIGAAVWIALLALAPDLSFAAYALGPAAGAAGYNLLHNLVLPIALGTAAVLWDSDWGAAVALIWLTHIGVDRLLGYGLKYPTAFKDSHLQRV